MPATFNLSDYRSSILFAGGLVLAAGLAMSLDGGLRLLALSGATKVDYASEGLFTPAAPRALSDAERERAVVAWAYIEQNTRAETGWVDSVAGFPSTTLWDQGSYLLGLVAARQLGLVEDGDFDDRVRRMLDSFARLPLHDDKLPNKVYDTRTLAMVDYANRPAPEGVGWSALDIARMLTAFRVLERHMPQYGGEIRDVLSTWDLASMAQNGELYGAERADGETRLVQEGRMGYEQYAARAAAMWGLDVVQAISAERVLDWHTVSGVDVPVDLREHTAFQAITPTLSEPYLLQAFEFGLDSEALRLAGRVYAAQEQRYRSTGLLTAVSEDHIDRAPHFLYSSVFANGKAWNVVAEDGEAHTDLRTLSLKASIGWDALFDTAYSEALVTAVDPLADPERGWPAGIYEADGAVNDVYTLNTNAIVLEALHFTARGPLWNVR
ncbi:DUF3131 domain-containing protein [Pseudaestuariivita atlantica]|uniref:DUF3131 domain-containing protein n=1 Tax=Pseudaestuariivita atlantica TaxID=1317121 RepID=A0A0L1JPF5_9RHOB|nr:DUF3131 domain-containing protein [Pseudaestuariivita atlantica]KNG93650.1 hypothetical protein ATO11_10630 [Pseudaestuariivita atlantica]